MKFLLSASLIIFTLPVLAFSQIIITRSGVAYTENFDSMGSAATASLPSGFRVGTTWTGGAFSTTQSYGSTGTDSVQTNSAGGFINWGNGVNSTATDRAIGILNTSGYTSQRSITLAIYNESSSPITSLKISFDYEKYKNGTRAFNWTFFHGTTPGPSVSAPDGNLSLSADADDSPIAIPLTIETKSINVEGINIGVGSHYYLKWTLTGTGAVGNTNGQGLAIDNFKILVPETTPPNTNFTSSFPTITNSSSASFAFTGTDNGEVASYKCSLDGAAFSACTSPVSYSGLTQGAHTFQAAAVDASGNVDPTPASQTWTIDLTAPTAIEGTNISVPTTSDQSYTVSASDTGGSSLSSITALYSLNNGSYTSAACTLSGSDYTCTIPTQVAGTTVRYYTEAKDGAGNTTQTPSSAAPNVYTVGSGAIVPAGFYSFAALGTSTLAGDISVAKTLQLNGKVDGSTYAITLLCAASISGAGTTNYINGFVDHTLCAATPTTYEYPVGTPAGYAPVSIVVNSYTGSTSLGVSPHDGAMQGVNAPTSLNRTWNIVRTGADTDTIDANVTFHYNDSDINGGDENNFKIFKKDGTTLTNYCYVPVNTLGLSPCSIDTVSNNATANGVTSFSQWTLGESLLSPTASDAAISGQVLTADGRGIAGAEVTVNGSSLEAPKRAVTNAFGYYTIEGVVAGQGYIVSVGAKRHVFAVPARFVTVGDNITDLDFTALP